MNNTKLFSLATMAAVLMTAGAAFALPPHVGLAAANPRHSNMPVSALTIDMRGGVNDKISVFPF